MNHDRPATGFNVLAVGWYGAPNVGDEVLLAVLKRQIARLGGHLTVVSVDPALTLRMHGTDAVDFNNLGEIAGALRWADVLVMGGGGIFQDHHPFRLQGVYDPVLSDISAYARPVLMAHQFGVPVVIWGHGVGPLDEADARDVVREIFDKAIAVSVRDDESLRLLREVGVSRPIEVGPDPGWLYARYGERHELPPPREEETCRQKTLALVVREWGGDDWKDKLVQALQSQVPGDWSVLWVAFQANIGESGATSDLGVLEGLRERVPDWAKGSLLTPASPDEAWSILSRADAILSMRLHASILGLSARKPVMGLEYDEKMARTHAMADVPSGLRVALGDPVERYVQALAILLDGAWAPSDDRIAALEERATVHLGLLDSLRKGMGGPKRWSGGHDDWLGTWLQQSLADLRATRTRSQRAHELLSYRDFMLSERDAQLGEAKARVLELDREMAKLGSLREGLKQAEAAMDGLLRSLGVFQEFTQGRAKATGQHAHVRQPEGTAESSGQASELGERVRALRIDLEEATDELECVNASFQDKEIYIARLLSRVGQLEADLAEARKGWWRVSKVFSSVRRRAARVAVAPFKFVAIWHKYGLRVALRQTSRRVAALGKGVLGGRQAAETDAGVPLVVRPVRTERLLVIGGAMQEEDWPSRAASLAMAGDRAGFFVRVWSAVPGQAACEPRLVPLLTSSAGLLDEVRDGTRVLLADLSPEALAAAGTARERGAEVILDLSSVSSSMLDAERLEALSTVVSRAVSHDDAGTPRMDWLEVGHLPDAGDNEKFDSYKNYPYPEEYRRRRRNLLLVVDQVDAQPVIHELARQLPHDHLLVAGGHTAGSRRVRTVTLSQNRLPGVLAAADAVLVANGGKAASHGLRMLVNAALLLERCVITDALVDDSLSKNLHALGALSWPMAVKSAEACEDYRFVSRNCWLGRVEQLMRGEFPRSVSAIVLIHNNRNIIERCLSTMLEHCGTWLLEIVVVDNQSSDGGAELVEQLYVGHPKVKLVRNVENGCSSGRNLGVKTTRGEFIVFFDSDQWLTAPSCFAEAVHLLETDRSVGPSGGMRAGSMPRGTISAVPFPTMCPCGA